MLRAAEKHHTALGIACLYLTEVFSLKPILSARIVGYTWIYLVGDFDFTLITYQRHFVQRLFADFFSGRDICWNCIAFCSVWAERITSKSYFLTCKLLLFLLSNHCSVEQDERLLFLCKRWLDCNGILEILNYLWSFGINIFIGCFTVYSYWKFLVLPFLNKIYFSI